jgi:hypothetical protein
MSFDDEVIKFVCFTITMILGMIVLYFLNPYLPDYTGHLEDDLVIVLIINALAIFSIGVYCILTKIVFRIKPSEKKS